MDKNWHRRLSILALLRAAPYTKSRCQGVKFDSKDHKYDRYLKYDIAAYLKAQNRVDGTVGCWIAHSRALEEVTERSGLTVVLEDDFICQPDFFENALRMVNAFDRDFDVILFDPFGVGPLDVHKIAENIYHTQNYNFPFYHGAHCLFINNAKIPKILVAKLNSQVWDYDGFLLAGGKLSTYIFYTGRCSARTGIGSDISTDQRLKYDFLGLLLLLLPSVLKVKVKRFKRYFDKPEEKKIASLSKEKLKTYEGYYELQGHSNLYVKLTIKKGNLVLNQSWDGMEFMLLPLSEEDFYRKGGLKTPLKFKKDKFGKVVSILMDNQVFCKNNELELIIPKAITLAHSQLKVFEGKYQQVKGSIIQVTAIEDHLLIKQLWDGGKELQFIPESELKFFAKDNPSFPIRFIKAKDDKIIKFIACEKDTLDRIS